MKWLDNAPADKRPEKLKKFLLNFEIFIIILIPTELFLCIIFFRYFDTILLWLTVLIEFIVVVFLYFIPLIFDRYGLPRYISFSKKGIYWKTKSGKKGMIEYSDIKSIMKTTIKPFTKKIPLEENIYTVTYKIKSAFYNSPQPQERDLWMLLPRGLVLNRKNTKILIQNLKEIDPELKNVEIVGWNEK